MAAFDTKSIVLNHKNWRDATLALVAAYIDEEECFSSGEIARDLRLADSDLRFSVLGLGEFLRDLFWASGMGDYVQVNRIASGLHRTPAGQPVYVYAPDKEEGDDHDFEVEVPLPPGVKARTPSPTPSATGYPTAVTPTSGYPTQVSAPTITPPRDGYTVRVLKDFRINVRRSVFDRYIHAANVAVKPGHLVWVKVEADKATVSFDKIDGGSQYQINDGRVIFPSGLQTPFVPGTTYPVTVTDGALTIDLTQGS